MHAYVDSAFRTYYLPILRAWVAVQESTAIRDKTLAVCFNDFANQPGATAATMLDHLYNGTSHPRSKLGSANNSSSFAGHSTSHDPTLRGHLKAVIQQIDEQYYNGDIAWLNSILPCQA